jgi:hypothetical protein
MSADHPERDVFVEAAGAIPLEIDGDVVETRGLDRRRNRLRDPGLDGAGEIGPRQLEACDVAVVADAAAAEAEAAERNAAKVISLERSSTSMTSPLFFRCWQLSRSAGRYGGRESAIWSALPAGSTATWATVLLT